MGEVGRRQVPAARPGRSYTQRMSLHRTKNVKCPFCSGGRVGLEPGPAWGRTEQDGCVLARTG